MKDFWKKYRIKFKKLNNEHFKWKMKYIINISNNNEKKTCPPK